MENLFKNEERQALLEELVTVCQSMADNGVPDVERRLVKASDRLNLMYTSSSKNNGLYIDLFSSAGGSIQPYEIVVFTQNQDTWVHLEYETEFRRRQHVDVLLCDVVEPLADLIKGIRSQSRVVAFLHALRLNLRGFIYWEG